VLRLKGISIAVLLAGVVGALTCIEAAGQETNPGDMIHAYRVWKLTEVLNLTDEEMPVFFTRLKELDEKEVELVREEQRGVREIADLLQKEDASEEDLRHALDRYEQNRANLTEEIGNLRRETLSVLDAKQRCEYVVFEHRFRAELRDMIERAREFGRGQSGRPDEDKDFGRLDPGGRGVGGGMQGGSGRGRR
jgi:hypothetical protein